MSSTANQTNHSLLKATPPRSLPTWLIADLLGDQLLERPLRSYFDPLMVSGIVAAVALALLSAPLPLSWLVACLLAVRLGLLIWGFLSRSLGDLRLLRHGVIVRAHVLRLRLEPTSNSDKGGAYLDCAMPISRQRTSVGSVWLSDAEEAARLHTQGRVQVICLPRAPGDWRLLEGKSADFRYEPLPERRQKPAEE